MQDRIKINNCDKSVKQMLKAQKQRDEDPLKVTREDIERLNSEVKTLNEYVFEKFSLFAEMEKGTSYRIETIEKRVFDEPDHVLNYLKKEMDTTKVKVGNEISQMMASMTEDQTLFS